MSSMPENEEKPNYRRNYSLVGADTALAIENGWAEATWYISPVPKDTLRELLQRRDGPAIRDTLLWLALIIGSGIASYQLWLAGSTWAVLAFLIYGTLYASTSDSRWHETSHGTAFKTDWMNNLLYEVSSFMVMRESTPWRWSHTRHHSDTIIVGRDPEIAIQRPPDIVTLILVFFGVGSLRAYFKQIFLHSAGRLTEEERTYIPESEYAKVFLRARIYVLIYAGVVGLSLYQQSILPLLFVGLPTLFGSWLMPIYGHTQHAGLADNVLDHRLNCRTVYMNLVNRYLYWNMNYHVEHHMFPLVPYHNLPRLHEILKADMPTPYRSIWHAWCELLPAVLKQVRDPDYFVERKLPVPANPTHRQAMTHVFTAKGQAENGWVEVCAEHFLRTEDVIRFDHEQKTYAIYRTSDGALYATEGICTHGNTHLADGLVKGKLIECAKHNGRFDITDGSPQRQPACVGLKTFKVLTRDAKILLNISSAHGCGTEVSAITYAFRVVSNDNVATFIKELVLEPEPGSLRPNYHPGQYLQLDVPAYGGLAFREITVQAPFSETWEKQNLFNLNARNDAPLRRNYSLASNPATDEQLRFNVRIALPPRDQDCLAGTGSAYIHRLKPGDRVTAIGPFGDFLIKPGEAEMVYVGGGAGMAPLRSHLSHLFETIKTTRRVSFWYGARSSRDVFYKTYFEELARQHSNFTFYLALSEPQPDEIWQSSTGLIHEVLHAKYLSAHRDAKSAEYYLCGPPGMISATRDMLKSLAVPDQKIAYDEF